MNVGRVKFWAERQINYISRIQLPVVLMLWFDSHDLSYWWMLLLVPISAVVWYIDKHYVIPGEYQVGYDMNPGFKRLEALIRDKSNV